MSFTAKDVAELRRITNVGMMKCKEALSECNGNIDEAVNYLRQKGIAGAAKKIANVAAEGIIASAVAADKKSVALVEINCQTDFVAKNDDFIALSKKVANFVLEQKTDNLETLLAADFEGKSLNDSILEQISKIGEKLELRRAAFIASDTVVGAYVHPVGSKVGAIVALTGDSASEEKAADVAMHITASSPTPEFRSRDDIPAEVIESEKQIELGKEDLAGKPEEIKEKIVEGRINKLLASKTLDEQAFIKNPDQKVKDYLAPATIQSFIYLKVGEGVEKKEDNFADEVASMMKS
ncbi:MAG: translation elongation factor Ts [Candidatus Caenarcaniphilales bacterium]|nr:translation elongation factor Ts [Candidatus Caenarcaniphilales bacterium]